MRWGQLGGLLVGAGALVTSAAGLYEALLRRPLPQWRGTLAVPSLGAAVEVVRDAWGVPHVRAASLADAFAAQGVVHAQDRLWQLELNRRVASGRLAEIFGERALPADRFLRRIGLRRAAEVEAAHLTPETRALLEAYCAGVNAGMAANRALPFEFQLLRHRPEPWTVLDSLAHAKMLAWTLSANWETELLRARLVARLGPEGAARVEPTDVPALVSVDLATSETAAAALLAEYERAAEFVDLLAPGASNAWAVSAERSSTGAPLLASDPHLALHLPNIWYELHLTCPETDVAGGSIVGLPGIVIGHNGHVAWGLTAAPVDVQDLYLERFHPDDPMRYEVDGEWRLARIVGEVIRVKGREAAVIEQVIITRHGPIITPLPNAGGALALRWTAHGYDRFLETVIGVNVARDWPAVRAALAGLGGPPINVTCATRSGDIAYQLAGHIPTRPGGGGLLPVAGWTSAHDWGPPIPFEQLPAAINPPDGVVVSANNRVGGPDYPYYLGNDWLNGYRARRIHQLLTERERHSLADFARIQMDVLTLPGQRLQRRLSQLSPEALSPAARQAFDLIRAWDGEMRAESAGAAVYGRLMPAILHRLFEPIMGDLLHEYLGHAQHPVGTINQFFGRATPLALDLLDDPALGGLATPPPSRDGASPADTLLRAALEESAADLNRLLGPDQSRWRWGAIHQLVWQHPLGTIKPLAPLLNRGPYPLAGHLDTINYAATVPYPPAGVATHAWVPGYRLLVDLANPDRSVSLLAGGISGHPGSRHYADQIGAWLSGRYHALLYNRGAIDKATIYRLLLLPAS